MERVHPSDVFPCFISIIWKGVTARLHCDESDAIVCPCLFEPHKLASTDKPLAQDPSKGSWARGRWAWPVDCIGFWRPIDFERRNLNYESRDIVGSAINKYDSSSLFTTNSFIRWRLQFIGVFHFCWNDRSRRWIENSNTDGFAHWCKDDGDTAAVEESKEESGKNEKINRKRLRTLTRQQHEISHICRWQVHWTPCSGPRSEKCRN